MRRTWGLAPVLVGIALLVGSATSQGHPAGAHASAKVKTVKTRHTSLGTFLVDGKGMTLYLFEKDKGKKSKCYGQCAQFWPPALSSGKPKAGGKAKKSLLGTSKRKDGSKQVTYKGHPLYYFVQDTKPGDTTGEGSKAFGAGWYVVKPSGRKIDND
jgi:predicted lipoprotein with Yx(FWY)xxD motif